MNPLADAGPTLLDLFQGCLTGVAVGDALGAPLEGRPLVAVEDWLAISHGTERLRFTDDTHMTFGVIESLLATDDFDAAHLARIFIRDFDAEPWRGYGPGPVSVFAQIKAGIPWHQAGKSLYENEGSFGNGAAMRVAPIGLRYHDDPALAADVARLSASITHAHPLGKEGAAFQAVAVAIAVASSSLDAGSFVEDVLSYVRDRDMADAAQRVLSLVDMADPEDAAAMIGNGIAAIEAVPAALLAFLVKRGSFPDTIEFAVRMGGDTDTIASMAGALAGAHLGYQAIPQSWKDRVEGAPSMARLGRVLLERVSQDAREERRTSGGGAGTRETGG